MKKFSKRIIAAFLAVTTLLTASVSGAITTLAANYSTNYSSYNQPESNDFAYWNGKKVVKGSGTTTNEIKWMQAALNYCISKKGLNASKLDVDGSFGPASKKTTTAFQKKYGLSQDGSFGPATISKMKSVLSAKPTSSNTCSQSKNKITTSKIQSVLNKYNYKTGMYWTYKSGGSSSKSYMATTHKGRQYSYKYNGVECYGFANFIMHEVTGTSVNPNNGNKNGWEYLKPSKVTELKVGDIVRIGKSNSNGHSGVVLTVDSKGNCTFAQCLGGVNNKISIGKGLSSSSFGTHSTLKSMKNSGALLYVYRYVG